MSYFILITDHWNTLKPLYAAGPRVPLSNSILTWHFHCMVSDRPIANVFSPLGLTAPHNKQNLVSVSG